jgi:hypothetical protein
MAHRTALRPSLHPLDLFIKQGLGCRAYVRYCDDLVLFADDISTLHHWRTAAIAYTATLRLTLHEGRAQVVPVSTGCPFSAGGSTRTGAA